MLSKIKLSLIYLIAIYQSTVFAVSKKELACREFFQAKYPILFQDDVPRFTEIPVSDFVSFLIDTEKYEQEDLEVYLKSKAKPSFANVVLPHFKKKDVAGIHLWAGYGLMKVNLKAPGLDAIESEINRISSESSQRLYTNKKIFAKIDDFYKNRAKHNLSPLQLKMLTDLRNSFLENGINLSEAEQKKALQLEIQISNLEQKFADNMTEQDNSFIFEISANEVDGIYPEFLEKLRSASSSNGRTNYVMQGFSRNTFAHILENANSSSLRKRLYEASIRMNTKNSEFDNEAVALQISQARHESAQIYSYENYAASVLKDRMVKSPQKLEEFIKKMGSVYFEMAQKDNEQFFDFLDANYPGVVFKTADGTRTIHAYDRPFFMKKFETSKTGIDHEDLKQYFQLDRVWQTAFYVAEKLYGIQIAESNQIFKFHPDVKTYEIRDKKNKLLSYLLVDSFERPGQKRNGAWHIALRNSFLLKNKRTPAIINITSNFAKNEKQTIYLDDVVTVFHEFGHALHSILSKTRYYAHSGTKVARDMVELPSQFNEFYVYQPEVLKRMAIHSDTGQVISDQYIKQIIESKNFFFGSYGLRQIAMAAVDLKWHIQKIESVDILDFEKEVWLSLGIPENELVNFQRNLLFSPRLNHIFAAGYAAGLYSYQWADVLASHAFAVFKKEGIWNKKTAERFRREILSKGGSVDALEAFVRFAGEEPNPKFLIEVNN